MSAREGFEKVSKEEFDEFLASYPNELSRSGTAICSPPCCEYSDASRTIEDKWIPGWRKFSYSVVAYYFDEFMGLEPTYYVRIDDSDKPVCDEKCLKEIIYERDTSIENLQKDIEFYKSAMEALEKELDAKSYEIRRLREFIETCRQLCTVRRCDEVSRGEEDTN